MSDTSLQKAFADLRQRDLAALKRAKLAYEDAQARFQDTHHLDEQILWDARRNQAADRYLEIWDRLVAQGVIPQWDQAAQVFRVVEAK